MFGCEFYDVCPLRVEEGLDDQFLGQIYQPRYVANFLILLATPAGFGTGDYQLWRLRQNFHLYFD